MPVTGISPKMLGRKLIGRLLIMQILMQIALKMANFDTARLEGTAFKSAVDVIRGYF